MYKRVLNYIARRILKDNSNQLRTPIILIDNDLIKIMVDVLRDRGGTVQHVPQTKSNTKLTATLNLCYHTCFHILWKSDGPATKPVQGRNEKKLGVEGRVYLIEFCSVFLHFTLS